MINLKVISIEIIQLATDYKKKKKNPKNSKEQTEANNLALRSH